MKKTLILFILLGLVGINASAYSFSTNNNDQICKEEEKIKKPLPEEEEEEDLEDSCD